MKPNLGSPDKIIRILIAITFFVLFYLGKVEGTTGILMVVGGVILLSTVFLNFCPIYFLFGLSTRKKEN
jgi:hypothetical protein